MTLRSRFDFAFFQLKVEPDPLLKDLLISRTTIQRARISSLSLQTQSIDPLNHMLIRWKFWRSAVRRQKGRRSPRRKNLPRCNSHFPCLLSILTSSHPQALSWTKNGHCGATTNHSTCVEIASNSGCSVRRRASHRHFEVPTCYVARDLPKPQTLTNARSIVLVVTPVRNCVPGLTVLESDVHKLAACSGLQPRFTTAAGSPCGPSGLRSRMLGRKVLHTSPSSLAPSILPYGCTLHSGQAFRLMNSA